MTKSATVCFCAAVLTMTAFTFADKPEDRIPEPPAPPEAPAAPKKAFVGVVTEKVSSATAIQLGLQPEVGLTIKSIVQGSSAEEYGLEKYDILMEMDNQWLTSVSHFTTLLKMKKPGDVASFKVLRSGKELTVDVTLGEKASREFNEKWEWKFEEKMEEFGRRMEELAEKEEIVKHMRESVNSGEIEETVRSALEKAQYHINQWVGEDGSHTSIIHSGNARSIITTEDGTLIVEGAEDDKSRVIAISTDDQVLFNGLVSDDAVELEEVDSWVKKQFEKLSKKQVKVIVSDDIDITTEIVESESDDAG